MDSLKKLIIALAALLAAAAFAACTAKPQPDGAPAADAPAGSEAETAGETPVAQDTEPKAVETYADRNDDDLLALAMPYARVYEEVLDETYLCDPDWEHPFIAYYESEEPYVTDEMPAKLVPIQDLLDEDGLLPDTYDGLYIDPVTAYYYPSQAFDTLEEMKAALAEYLAPEANVGEQYYEYVAVELFGELYIVRGGRGYGAERLEVDSGVIVDKTATGFAVAYDKYLFGEFDGAYVLHFADTDEGLRIVEIGESVG